MTTMKKVNKIIRETSAHWVGDGFNVTPVFNDMAFTPSLSPFLMFDYGFPKHYAPTSKKLGVGMHPHRGFETVTIAFQGEIEHKDNKGNTGVIAAGDVQWMTAGSGIFHEEFHSRKFAKEGGNIEMCQLWLNLPARLKMTKPRYQAIEAKDIPQVKLPDDAGIVRVIAGEFAGAKGPVVTELDEKIKRGHVELWDVRVNAGKTASLTVPEGHTCVLFVRSGAVELGDGSKLGKARVAIMETDGDSISISAGKEGAALLLMGGEPYLGSDGEVEPIVQHGPMVMNTRKEINEAMAWAREEQYKMF